MHLHQIVSYGDAWNTVNERFPQELDDIRAAVARLTPENIAAAQPMREMPFRLEPGLTRYRLEGCWDAAIRGYGWQESRAAIKGAGSRPIQMRGLGYVKNRASVALLRHRESVNRWLYTLAPIATRNDFIEIPIGVSLLEATEEAFFGRRPMMMAMFERTKEDLLALSPLSHPNPFLLLGISHKDQCLEVTELKCEGDSVSRQIVINRSIEFAPEHHQAGLGILSYFGTVLREKYPEHNAKVRIEQEGLRVRLVIESDNGDKEVIEKALQEYELVVRGETSPETFFDNKAKVLELKNELRIAHVRIESQKDLITYQGQEIASLRQLFGHSLTVTNSQPLCISVNPVITISNATDLNVQQNAPLISEYVQELSALAANDPDIELRLLDLEESLDAMATKNTVEAVKESAGMRKLKRWLDEAAQAGSTANTFLQKVTDGIGLVQKLARHYNDLAAWCGAPQVPPVL